MAAAQAPSATCSPHLTGKLMQGCLLWVRLAAPACCGCARLLLARLDTRGPQLQTTLRLPLDSLHEGPCCTPVLFSRSSSHCPCLT